MVHESKTRRTIRFVLVVILALALLYPLIWMVFASFKYEPDFFNNMGLIPHTWTLENYIVGWQSSGKNTFTTYFQNSIAMSLLCVVGNLFSCTLAAYAFARLDFKMKSICFALMMMMMMLPQHATLVPQYVYFHRLGWLDSILPIIVPKFLGHDGFFIFLIVQFIRGLPRELDEAAIVDGCNRYTLFFRVLLPLCVPALITTFIFTFMWSWNDFFTQMLYLSSQSKFTVTLGLRMFIDATDRSNYAAMMAMSSLSLIPILIIFILFQRYLIEGIATSGIKG